MLLCICFQEIVLYYELNDNLNANTPKQQNNHAYTGHGVIIVSCNLGYGYDFQMNEFFFLSGNHLSYYLTLL